MHDILYYDRHIIHINTDVTNEREQRQSVGLLSLTHFLKLLLFILNFEISISVEQHYLLEYTHSHLHLYRHLKHMYLTPFERRLECF